MAHKPARPKSLPAAWPKRVSDISWREWLPIQKSVTWLELEFVSLELESVSSWENISFYFHFWVDYLLSFEFNFIWADIFVIIFQEELLQLKTIEKSLAVFCLATYGEGDPTDNAMEFWEWIQGDVDLSGLNYAVSHGSAYPKNHRWQTLNCCPMYCVCVRVDLLKSHAR